MSTCHVIFPTYHIIADVSYHVSSVGQSKATMWPLEERERGPPSLVFSCFPLYLKIGPPRWFWSISQYRWFLIVSDPLPRWSTNHWCHMEEREGEAWPFVCAYISFLNRNPPLLVVQHYITISPVRIVLSLETPSITNRQFLICDINEWRIANLLLSMIFTCLDSSMLIWNFDELSQVPIVIFLQHLAIFWVFWAF